MKKTNKTYTTKYIKESELFDDDNMIIEDDEPETPKSVEIDSDIDEASLRVDALKYAMKIGRMLDNFQIQDALQISELVMSFLKNYTPGCDIREILGLEKLNDEGSESTKDNSEEDEPENTESEETSDNETSEDDIDIDDLENFTIEDDESESDEDDTNEASSEVPDQFII